MLLQNIAPDPNLAVAALLVVTGYCFSLLLCVHFILFEIALYHDDMLLPV